MARHASGSVRRRTENWAGRFVGDVQRGRDLGAVDRRGPGASVRVAGDDPGREQQFALAFEWQRADNAWPRAHWRVVVADVAHPVEHAPRIGCREARRHTGRHESRASVEPGEAARPEVREEVAGVVDRLAVSHELPPRIGREAGRHARVPVSSCAAPNPSVCCETLSKPCRASISASSAGGGRYAVDAGR